MIETLSTKSKNNQKEKRISTLPPYSESEYKCHLFNDSFELKSKTSFSVGGIKSSTFHARAVCQHEGNNYKHSIQ